MTLYILIGLSLSLVVTAGLQFFYMIFLERINREQKKRLRELERNNRYFSQRLSEAEQKIAEQNEILEGMFNEPEAEEVWADVIEDR